MRRHGVVYVSLNYRLGALGWLDFRAYASPRHPFECNLGLRDQVAALEWVRRNIRAFGGDPGNVTLFGESSGANSVTTLMTVPAAEGLFGRAIAQSSPAYAVYLPEIAAKWAAEYVSTLSRLVDDDDLESESVEDAAAMLHTADPTLLAEATTRLSLRTPDENPGTISLAPVIDGEFLPEQPLDAFRDGTAHRIPLIIGTNDREGSLFAGRISILPTTKPRIRAIFANTRKKARKAIKRQYPGLPERRPAADFAGDFTFWFPSVKVGERHSRHAPVYFYRFDAAPRMPRLLGLDATHGLELFALFEKFDTPTGAGLTLLGGRRLYRDVGRRMQRHWVSFAASGAPEPTWPSYDEAVRRTLVFDRTRPRRVGPAALEAARVGGLRAARVRRAVRRSCAASAHLTEADAAHLGRCGRRRAQPMNSMTSAQKSRPSVSNRPFSSPPMNSMNSSSSGLLGVPLMSRTICAVWRPASTNRRVPSSSEYFVAPVAAMSMVIVSSPLSVTCRSLSLPRRTKPKDSPVSTFVHVARTSIELAP